VEIIPSVIVNVMVILI